MIAAGVDIGSTTTKVAVLDGGALLGFVIVPSGGLPGRTAVEAYARTLAEAGLDEGEVDVVATTGYGRRLADFGDLVMTEIKACALGVRCPAAWDEGETSTVRTVIDVGGQDTKVITIDEAGEVEDFGMNDKCAAGTGRFLEVLAAKLELTYEEFVAEALKSETMVQMNATCAVFAESEVVGLLARGVSKSDVAAAAHNAIATRIASMVRRVGPGPDYAIVGGGARNDALVAATSEALNHPLRVPARPQLVVALGAAVGAAARLARIESKENA